MSGFFSQFFFASNFMVDSYKHPTSMKEVAGSKNIGVGTEKYVKKSNVPFACTVSYGTISPSDFVGRAFQI